MAGGYSWKEELPDVPEEFAYLNQFDNVSITSARGEKDKWYVRFDRWEMGSKAREEYLDSKAKERLDLYLLAEPLVDCDNNYFGDFCDKTDYRWWKSMRMNDGSCVLGNIFMKYLFPGGYAIIFIEGQVAKNEKTMGIETGFKKPAR